MYKIYEIEGKNKEELIEKALTDLNANKNEAIINIEETEAKLFKSKKYKIQVILKIDIKNYIKDYIKDFSKNSGIDMQLEVLENENIYSVNVLSDDSAILIGKDGKNLKSLQLLLRQSVLRKFNTNIKINLDIAGYKAKKTTRLEREIKKLAREVLKTKIDVKLDPMNSYERRIVHSLISTYDNLSTESVGEEPNRYTIIHYIEK
ncbi:MAG: KH domain-containing protein [Bacilli bacterium]|nr:KH domain-containing protein [Bacilli bacterium]